MKSFTAILGLAAAANAHMIMKTPTPFNAPDSSPLELTGSNYPCKVEGGNVDVSSGPDNALQVGAQNTLSFTGSAVHGGGSCQVSIAKGSTANKDTKFLVIASYLGGCPADTTSSGGGNLPADPSGSGAGTFQYSIPDHPDIPTGDAILAWTWNNRIGNREMYMNCAKVTIGGASKKRYAPASYSKRDQAPLPEMFKANIGNGCATTEGVDVTYPDPGSNVVTGANYKPGPPVGSCGAVGAAQPGSGTAPSSAAGSAPSPTAVTPVASATGGAGSPAISQSVGGGFATVSASAGASSPTSAATQPSSSAAAAPVASASPVSSAPAAPIGTGTSGSGSSATGTCTTGDWNCAADGKSFTRCIAGGTWSASMPVSEGMSCTPGISANFGYNKSVGSAKRDIRSHVARKRHSLEGSVLS